MDIIYSQSVVQNNFDIAILFCVYVNDLIKEHLKNRDSCWITQRFVGIAMYADDIVLLSPSLDGLQNMVDTCSSYAKTFNLKFSTNENIQKSKTKCMPFLQKYRKLRNFHQDGKALPWVNCIKYLGSTIKNNRDCNMKQDLVKKELHTSPEIMN